MFATQTKPQQSRNTTASNNRINYHVADIEGRMTRADTFGKWQFVLGEIAKHDFVPAKLVYRFIEHCPAVFTNGDAGINLRKQLIKDLRDFILKDLTYTNIAKRESRFAVLMQAGAFYSPAEYLTQKSLVLLAYIKAVELQKALGEKPTPVPLPLRERMRNIESVLRRSNDLNHRVLLDAGYVCTVNNGSMSVYAHKATGDSVTVHAAPCVIDTDTNAKMKLQAESRRNSNRELRLKAQPPKGSGGAKPQASSGKKAKGKK